MTLLLPVDTANTSQQQRCYCLLLQHIPLNSNAVAACWYGTYHLTAMLLLPVGMANTI